MMILMSNAIQYSSKGSGLLIDMEFVPSKKTKDIQQLEQEQGLQILPNGNAIYPQKKSSLTKILEKTLKDLIKSKDTEGAYNEAIKSSPVKTDLSSIDELMH